MKSQNWFPIVGNVDTTDGTITHQPVPISTGPDSMPSADGTPVQAPLAVVRSNLDFEQGTITWEAKLGEKSERAQLMLAADPGGAGGALDSSRGDSSTAELAVGLNVLNAPYGFAVWNGSWKGVGGAGHGSALPVGEWLHLKLTVKGSINDLYIEGVKVASTSLTLKKGPIGVLLQGDKGPSIRNLAVVQDSPMCFAVMQFTEEFNVLYKDVIRPMCESYGYNVVRGDDFYTSGQIMDDVTHSIRASALIIADVTPDNANVFYEVGYAHAIGKPTILLSDRKRERLPFDISGFRTLFYDNTIGGRAVVEARLKQHLDALRPK